MEPDLLRGPDQLLTGGDIRWLVDMQLNGIECRYLRPVDDRSRGSLSICQETFSASEWTENMKICVSFAERKIRDAEACALDWQVQRDNERRAARDKVRSECG